MPQINFRASDERYAGLKAFADDNKMTPSDVLRLLLDAVIPGVAPNDDTRTASIVALLGLLDPAAGRYFATRLQGSQVSASGPKDGAGVLALLFSESVLYRILQAADNLTTDDERTMAAYENIEFRYELFDKMLERIDRKIFGEKVDPDEDAIT